MCVGVGVGVGGWSRDVTTRRKGVLGNFGETRWWVGGVLVPRGARGALLGVFWGVCFLCVLGCVFLGFLTI